MYSHIAVSFIIGQHGPQVGFSETGKVSPKIFYSKWDRNGTTPREVNRLIGKRFGSHAGTVRPTRGRIQEPIMIDLSNLS